MAIKLIDQQLIRLSYIIEIDHYRVKKWNSHITTLMVLYNPLILVHHIVHGELICLIIAFINLLNKIGKEIKIIISKRVNIKGSQKHSTIFEGKILTHSWYLIALIIQNLIGII